MGIITLATHHICMNSSNHQSAYNADQTSIADIVVFETEVAAEDRHGSCVPKSQKFEVGEQLF